MSFNLQNPPVKIVAAALQLEKHPDFESIIKRSHDSIRDVYSGRYETTETPKFQISMQGGSTVSQIMQHHYLSADGASVISIKGDEVLIGTNTYAGFDELAKTIAQFVGIFEMNKFPNVVGVSYRYMNRLIDKLPSKLLKPEVQGPAWGTHPHVHYDARTWIDLGDSRSVSIFVSATAPHAPPVAGNANMPQVPFLTVDDEATTDGINLDLVGTRLSCHLPMNPEELIGELALLRTETKAVFESVATEDGMAKWGKSQHG